jgi:two-component system, NtrC family, response regulator AtoC
MSDPKYHADQTSIGVASAQPGLTLRNRRTATEIDAISWALEQTGWNRKRAADLLSISYRGLLYKIRQYNITPNTELSLSRKLGE